MVSLNSVSRAVPLSESTLITPPVTASSALVPQSPQPNHTPDNARIFSRTSSFVSLPPSPKTAAPAPPAEEKPRGSASVQLAAVLQNKKILLAAVAASLLGGAIVAGATPAASLLQTVALELLQGPLLRLAERPFHANSSKTTGPRRALLQSSELPNGGIGSAPAPSAFAAVTASGAAPAPAPASQAGFAPDAAIASGVPASAPLATALSPTAATGTSHPSGFPYWLLALLAGLLVAGGGYAAYRRYKQKQDERNALGA